MTEDLSKINLKVYDGCQFEIKAVTIEKEGKEYSAAQFELNDSKVISRTAKITPTKTGQFVTFWKRNKQGVTEPYKESDDFDFYVVNVKNDLEFGQFVFPKSILIKKGIISTELKDGKRGFRVYPDWSSVNSKQAIQTKKWQSHYFYRVDNSLDYKIVKKLYSMK